LIFVEEPGTCDALVHGNTAHIGSGNDLHLSSHNSFAPIGYSPTVRPLSVASDLEVFALNISFAVSAHPRFLFSRLAMITPALGSW
jgi:hypothetical protein